MGETIPLYHYTDENGVKGITREMRIGQSLAGKGRGDAVYGSGVYLTSIHPDDSSKVDVILNNFDGGSDKHTQMKAIVRNFHKAKKVIKVYVRTDEVERVDKVRDVYLVKGDLDLTTHEYEILDGPTKLTAANIGW